jgi:hypothetical protein
MLTDDEIYEIADSEECNPNRSGWGPKFDFLAFARAIERRITGKPSMPFNVVESAAIPPGEVHVRAKDGRLLGRITGVERS